MRLVLLRLLQTSCGFFVSHFIRQLAQLQDPVFERWQPTNLVKPG